jgi:hypothetical protein
MSALGVRFGFDLVDIACEAGTELLRFLNF